MGFIGRLLHRVPDPDDWHVEDMKTADMGLRPVDGSYTDYGERIQVAIKKPNPSLVAGHDYGWDVHFEKESYVEVYNDGRREPAVNYTATYRRDMLTIYEGNGDSMLDAATDLVEQLLADSVS